MQPSWCRPEGRSGTASIGTARIDAFYAISHRTGPPTNDGSDRGCEGLFYFYPTQTCFFSETTL